MGSLSIRACVKSNLLVDRHWSYSYDGDCQIGFARSFTDRETLAYLADVYVLPAYRGRGLGVELVREMIDAGPYANLRWLLHTRDAHNLYRRFGFTSPSERLMERAPP